MGWPRRRGATRAPARCIWRRFWHRFWRGWALAGLAWLAGLGLLTLSAPAAAAGEPDAQARAFVAAHPVVRIGVLADNTPYSGVRDGRVEGFSIDVLRELQARTGLRFEMRAGNWPELYRAFRNGELDAIDEISFREDRVAFTLFTPPYHLRETVLLHSTERPLPPARRLADLRGKRVGILRDIYYKPQLAAAGADLREYDGLDALVRALAFGWVDAVVGPAVTMAFIARRDGLAQVAVAGPLAMDGAEIEDFRIGVRRDWPALQRVLALALAALPPGWLDERLALWRDSGGPRAAAAGFRLDAEERAYLHRLGTLRVGMVADYAPFSFVDNGAVRGLSMDVLGRLGDITGLGFEPVVDTWGALLERFKRGELDVLADMSWASHRLAFTRFTEPYFVIPQVVYARRGALAYSGPASLRGRRVGLLAGIFYEPAVRAQHGVAVTAFDRQDALFRALAAGAVDAALSSLPNGNHWLRELGLTDVDVVGEFALDGMHGEDLRLGVRPDLERLRGILDRALAALGPNERQQIENRWLGAAPIARSAAPAPLGDAERAYLRARGPLRYCVDARRMPLEGVNGAGHHVGLSADVLNLLKERGALDLQRVATASWTESIQRMQQRGCDLLPMAVATPDRRMHLAFTSPYHDEPNVLVARVQAPFVDDLRSVAGQRLGVVRGHAFAELLRLRVPGIQLVEVDDDADGLRRVQRGELFGHVGPMASVGRTMQALALADLKVAGRVAGDWRYAIGVRSDEPALLAIFDKLLASVDTDERRRIDEKWRTVRLEQRVDWHITAQMLAAAALVVALVAVWNHKLRSLNGRLADANARLEQLSRTDALTGLPNRQYFEAEYPRLHRWCQRGAVPLMVAMIDIDHFKALNDRHGHAAGDAVLRLLGAQLRHHLQRDSDHVARYGGEEFVVFIGGQTLAEAGIHLESLRRDVEQASVDIAGQQVGCTVSIGAAGVVPGEHADPHELLHRADAALYEAKSAGRNRVVLRADAAATA